MTGLTIDFFSSAAIPLSFRDDTNRNSTIIRAQKNTACVP